MLYLDTIHVLHHLISKDCEIAKRRLIRGVHSDGCRDGCGAAGACQASLTSKEFKDLRLTLLHVSLERFGSISVGLRTRSLGSVNLRQRKRSVASSFPHVRLPHQLIVLLLLRCRPDAKRAGRSGELPARDERIDGKLAPCLVRYGFEGNVVGCTQGCAGRFNASFEAVAAVSLS